MADKKVDATTREVQEEKKFQYFDRCGETLEDNEQLSPIRHTIHCKPVYNYQSVEFDWDIHIGNEEEDLADMEHLYTMMLEMLVRVSQNAPQKDVSKPVQPQEELASEKQKQILRDFHIEFKEPLTKKQAHALIKKSMDQEIF